MFQDEDTVDFFGRHRKAAADWALGLLSRNPNSWVILDTETTGLDDLAQVIQIGVIDGFGRVLMDNVLVKPTVPVSRGAEAVHGIGATMLANAPSFADVLPTLLAVLSGKHIVIYNASFDLRILHQSAFPVGLSFPQVDSSCAMLMYSEWVGDWNDYYSSFRWQRLPGGDHTALGDCRSTLAIIRKMAGMND